MRIKDHDKRVNIQMFSGFFVIMTLIVVFKLLSPTINSYQESIKTYTIKVVDGKCYLNKKPIPLDSLEEYIIRDVKE